jgi:alpha-ketoglutarate-dependent taurine dioxygenase
MLLDEHGLERDGYSFMPDVRERDLSHTVRQLGPIRVDPRTPEPVRDIRPQLLQVAKENTLSSRYGTDAFPFHTDTAHWDRPARYLVLYCVDPGEGKRATLLQDSRLWRLDEVEKDLACRALWKTGHLRPRLCVLAEGAGGELTIRYDMDCMRPMTKEAQELKVLVEARISCSAQLRIEWQPECLLIIDNRRMVHARGKSSQPDKHRVLKRMLIGGD